MADEQGPWTDFAAPAAPPQESGPWQDFAPQQPREVDKATVEAVKPFFKPIMRAFGEGFVEGWGPDQLGISEQNKKILADAGFFRKADRADRYSPFGAFNELLFETAVRSGEVLLRGGAGLFRGGQAATMEALGGGQFGRTIASIPEAFFGSPGQFARPKPFVRPTPIEPIEGPPAVRTRAQLAQTGDPIVDGVLAHPTIRGVIDNAQIDRQHTIPYEAGGSTPIDNPTTYVDKHVPQTFTVRRLSDPNEFVKFDTGEPMAIHENVEEFVMDKLIAAGMKPEEAYRVAHFEFAQRAERAWYEANDIDPDAANAQWKKLQPGIQHEIAAETPADLYHKEYPGQDVTKARHEELFEAPPTPDEIARGRDIMAQALVEDAVKRPRAPDLAEARDLGVIGPEEAERPALETTKDVDKVMAARRAPDEKITQEVGGGDPWEERWKKFTSKIDKPEDVQRIIRDPALQEPDKFLPARRGEIPLADLSDLAEAGGVDPAMVDRAGVGRLLQNDAQVRLAMKAMLQAAEDVKSAAEALGQDASEANRIKLQETIMRRDIVLEQVLGFRGEWGRTGNVFQEFLRDVKDQEALSDFMRERGRSAADLDEIAAHIRGLSPKQAANYLSRGRELKPTGFWHWMWTQSLISGLVTHAKYFFANVLYTASERVVTPAIAATLGTILRSPDRVLFGEAVMGTMGLTFAMPRALGAAMRAWGTGARIALESEIKALERFKAQYDALVAAKQIPSEQLVKQIEMLTKAADQVSPYAEPGKVQAARAALANLPGWWGRIAYTGSQIITPGNMAMALHTTFKVMGEQASVDARAYRLVVKEGQHAVHSAEFWDRFDNVRNNMPTDELVGAIHDAYKGTFMQELGEQGKKFSKWTKEQKGVRWVFPFTHIPINIMKATYEHTPLAYADGEMRADLLGNNGARKRDMAVAHVLLGSSIMGYAAYQALIGNATGDYPTDPKERRQWKQNGTQANSIRLGDDWVSFNKFGPIGNLMALGADFMHQAHKIATDDEPNALKAIWGMTSTAIKLAKDEVGFLSLAMLYDAITDEKKGARWVANQVGTVLPYSSLVGQTAGFMDPNLREVKGFIDSLKYKIPVLRETLPPKRDVFGEPMANPLYHSLLRVQPIATDPVSRELDRLGIYPATPRNNIGGMQLPPKLYDRYLATAGAYTRTALEHWMQQPGWSALPDHVKEEAIRKSITTSRAAARAQIQVELLGTPSDIVQAGIENKARKIRGEKPVRKLPEPATP